MIMKSLKWWLFPTKILEFEMSQELSLVESNKWFAYHMPNKQCFYFYRFDSFSFIGKTNSWKIYSFQDYSRRITFWRLPGFNWVLSMILMATSFPVGTCLASFTLAKFPLPIVFSNLYLPMWGSSEVRLLEESRPPLLDTPTPSPVCKQIKIIC